MFANIEQFDSFDRDFAAASSDEQTRLYNDIKHIYIQSIMEGNDNLKYEALTRLIEGSRSLGYDYATYERELDTLSRLYPNIQIAPPTYTVSSAPQEVDTTSQVLQLVESVVIDTELVEMNLTLEDTAVEEKPTAPSVKKEEVAAPANISIAKEPEIAVQTNTSKETNKTIATLPLKLLSIKQKDKAVIFSFDKEPILDEIQFSLLKDKTFRYIYNIKALLIEAVPKIKIDGVKDVRISQFDKDTVRVVFESEKELQLSQIVNDKELFFGVNSNYTNISVLFSTLNATAKTENKTKDTTVPSILSSVKKTVVIDAGHGGKDSGAIHLTQFEKHVVLQLALGIGKELTSRGYKVVYTREKDVYLKLRERTKVANDKNADVFISVHVNAAPKKSNAANFEGIETFFLSPTDSARSKNAAELENQSDIEEMDFYSKQTFLNFLNREKIIASHKLAIDIQQNSLAAVKKDFAKVADGGVREAPFWVLVGAQMPAVLLEVGYISNAGDRERMFNKKFQETFAQGVANGLDSYFYKNNN